ncbi:MAG: DUF1330 domain-containing protein [Pseudomonadales bacterium]|jgi:uncharacterized protein (DUF1330 family)|nr:DUF1330 domain-containing protein [Pseudomonadales bacterium]|tara:strand:- start:292 stop:720 length:429 start_codon:yes stop_codon:yes gene_type:complete
MQVINEVSADPEARDAFFDSLDPNAPLVMVNLLKFKEKAEYSDGRETSLSGGEAYNIYGEAVAKMIVALGGTRVHGGLVTNIMLGQVEELWDAVGIVEYPTPSAFRAMLESDEYQDMHIHREAGLAGQLNISTTSPGHAANR